MCSLLPLLPKDRSLCVGLTTAVPGCLLLPGLNIAGCSKLLPIVLHLPRQLGRMIQES